MYYKEISNNGKIEYFINEEKKIIIARYNLPCGSKCPDLTKDKYLCNAALHLMSDKEVAKFSSKDYYIGKAVCSEEDIFNVEKGKEIAKYRAYKAYYKDRLRVVHEIIKFYVSKTCEIQYVEEYVVKKICDTADAVYDITHEGEE